MPSTTSFILFENRRVARPTIKLAAQGCAAVIVRRPLAERMASVNVEAPLPVARKSYVVKKPADKLVCSLPFPYKAGFGFTPSGSPRTSEERERLRTERLAFLRRGRAYRGRKDQPTIKVWAGSALREEKYEREFVDTRTGFHRIVPNPALLAPPATNYGGQVLSPDMFCLVPEVRELAPHEWDEWRPTRRPEHFRVDDPFMLFVPSTNSSGTLFPDDLKRYFPREWYRARVAKIREVPVGKKHRVKAVAAVCRRSAMICGDAVILPHFPGLSCVFTFVASPLRVPALASAARRTRDYDVRQMLTPRKGPQVSKRRLIKFLEQSAGLTAICMIIDQIAQGRFAPLPQWIPFGDFVIYSFPRSLADPTLPIGVIGVSACKVQEVHSGRGCIFSLTKSTPGDASYVFGASVSTVTVLFTPTTEARRTLTEGVRRPLSGWCSGAFVVPTGEIRKGVGLTGEGAHVGRATRQHMVEELVLWHQRQRGLEFLKAGPTLRTGLPGNGGAPWVRGCPSPEGARCVESWPSRRWMHSGRATHPVSCDISLAFLGSFKVNLPVRRSLGSDTTSNGLFRVHYLIDQAAGTRICSSTVRGAIPKGARVVVSGDVTKGTLQSITATSRLLPCEDTAHGDQPLGLTAKWSFPLRPPTPRITRLPALALTSVVRRIATAACYGRQCRPKATSLHGDSCVGFPNPLDSPFEAVSLLLFTDIDLDQPELAVGCAPDQDFELPGSAQGSSPLIGLPDWAWLYSLYDWNIFFTDCLQVLSLGLPAGAWLVTSCFFGCLRLQLGLRIRFIIETLYVADWDGKHGSAGSEKG
ncbi:hypothetical protein EI94DRAFT_1869742 [Lactarius quietus]|nr:hypothetical protein EI94DRAFT_1869742 [Lactarius quietus]